MEKHISLYFTEGSSDKEYHVNLVPDPAGGDLWQVDIAYGRRGKPMNTGVKGSRLAYGKAEVLFDKTVESKTKKGYTPAESGQAFTFVSGELTGRASGVRPQLLTAIGADALGRAMADPGWIWQEKMDGERRLLIRDGDQVTAANRNGLIVPLDARIAEGLLALREERFTLDGEDLGNGLFAGFDLLSSEDDPAGARPYAERLSHMERLLSASPSPCFVKVPTARSPAEARELLDDVRTRGGEGIVGKDGAAPYVPGRGDAQVKFKFVESCTAVVTRRNDDRRSVSVGLFDGGADPVPVGNVTIPANHDIPAEGSVVEVQYLYAYEGGSLYQPVYKGTRSDQSHEDCRVAQLKYRTDQNYEAHAPVAKNVAAWDEDGPAL